MDNLDERIAELEQRIAEKKAYQRMYAPHKYASTWDYVAEGDRSGLDRMDASEAAYHNMLRQQEQQERMLALQQAQQEKMLGLQQDFTAKENALNRQNAKDIATMNKDNQKDAKLFEVKKQLTNLLSDKNILEAQGKPTYTIDNTINTILEEYPQLKERYSAPKPSYDPRANPDYQLAKFSKVNAKNSYVEDIQEAIDELSKYQTPEAARRLAELDLELELRKKADASGETLKNEIAAFNINSGDISDYLTNQGYTVAKAGKIYKLLDKNGKVVKPTRRASNNDNVNWD
jgi:hypothetical protein